MEAPVPFSEHEWNMIIPGLYQGGHVYQIIGQQFTTVLRGIDTFDHVVSLYTMPSHPNTIPDPGIRHTVFEFPDSSWGVHEYDRKDLHKTVKEISADLDQGNKVLVRCQAGYNRSGLVVALVLMEQGFTAQGAISLIREKRSPWALCNKAFVEYICEYENEQKGY